MIGRTYSKRASALQALSPMVTPKKVTKCDDDNTAVELSTVRDAEELVGMGAVNMLVDDIHDAIDSIDPTRRVTVVKAATALEQIINRIKGSSEFGRQFRAHHGLEKVFEWWSGEVQVQKELIWMFCHLGAKVRRVDHFVDLRWLFRTAIALIISSAIDYEYFKTCEPFVNQKNICGKTIAFYLIGKACLCKTTENANIVSSGLRDVLVYLENRDQQTLTVIDFAIGSGIKEAMEWAAKLLADGPYQAHELKVLVSLSGSPNGWLYCKQSQIDHLLQNLSCQTDCEWTIYALSVLINCVDRDDQSEQYDWVVNSNIETIKSIHERAMDDAKPYAALLLAFAIMNQTPKTVMIAPTILQSIHLALQTFITLPDLKSATSVKRLAERLKQNGWLSDPPK